MNPLIKKQLEKLKFLIGRWDENTTKINILQNEAGSLYLKQGMCYLIKVEDYIVHPFDGFNLHDNWNKGTHPNHIFMKCEVEQIMGKMVKVNTVGYDYQNQLDTNDIWSGWLPEKSIKILEVL